MTIRLANNITTNNSIYLFNNLLNSISMAPIFKINMYKKLSCCFN